MAMRVTTGMAMNLYRYNLQNATASMNDTMNKVMSQRQFDTFAEDPSSAIQAWRVRRAMVDNDSYQTNNNDTLKRIDIAWSSMALVCEKLVDSTGRYSDIRAMNDATAGAKVELGLLMSNTADSIVQTMNSAKYGDHFVFSGTDEMNVPFTWSDDGKTLYYRGVNVNAGMVENPATMSVPSWALDASGAEIPAGSGTDADGNITTTTGGVPYGMPASSSDVYEQAWIDYYTNSANGVDAFNPREAPGEANWGAADQFGVPAAVKDVTENDPAYNRLWAAYYTDQGDVARLDRLANEVQNVDLGMGLKEDTGGVVTGTAFNRSLPGIDMLGYGIDENGDPNNVVMVLKRLGEIFQGCDPESGKLTDADLEEATRLMDKLKSCQDAVNGKYTEIDTKGSYLEANQQRMELNASYLSEDLTNLEYLDPALAISQFMYQYTCYNAALKVGTQLLSQSLIDYMV